MTIEFAIPIEPTGQMRARSRAVTTKTGKAFATTYKAKEQRDREAMLMQLLSEHRPDECIDGALRIDVDMYFMPPKTFPKWKEELVRQEVMYHTKKPDKDNVQKMIYDCLQKLNYFVDDCYIADGRERKLLSYNPRWEIRIETLDCWDRMKREDVNLHVGKENNDDRP